MIASMCQPGTNGVDGSTTCQACRTNSRRCRVASSRSISSRSKGFVSNGAKLAELFIGKLRKVGSRRNLDRASGSASVLGVHHIAVAEQVLGEEGRGGV